MSHKSDDVIMYGVVKDGYVDVENADTARQSL